MANKNKPVGGHRIDLLLQCGHVLQEPIEAAIYTPKEGESRTCPRCKQQTIILKIGSMYWVDEEQK